MAKRGYSGCAIGAAIGCALLVVTLAAGVVALALALFLLTDAPSASPPPIPTARSVPDTDPDTVPDPPDEPPVALDPKLTVEATRANYAITGKSAGELRRQLDTLGPKDQSGRFDAYTHWNVRWTYSYDRTAAACAVTDVKVTVTVKITMPEWSPPPDASPELVSSWNRYIKALERHENGHRDNGVAAGRDVLSTLRSFGSRGTCTKSGEDANATGLEVVKRYQAKDKDYDRTTGHGRTQGARFP